MAKKKLILDLIMAHLTQTWGPKIFFVCFLSLLDVRKIYDPKSRKLQKTSFWPWFRPIGPKFKPPIFFYKTSS